MADCAALEMLCPPKGDRGFESPPLRSKIGVLRKLRFSKNLRSTFLFVPLIGTNIGTNREAKDFRVARGTSPFRFLLPTPPTKKSGELRFALRDVRSAVGSQKVNLLHFPLAVFVSQVAVVGHHLRVPVPYPFLDFSFRGSAQECLRHKVMPKGMQAPVLETDLSHSRGKLVFEGFDHVLHEDPPNRVGFEFTASWTMQEAPVGVRISDGPTLGGVEGESAFGGGAM